MEKIQGGQTAMMRKFQQSQRAGVDAYDKVRHSAVGYEGVLNRIKRLTVGIFATGAILMAARDLTAVTAKYQAYDNAINFASGSAAEAAKNQEFLAKTITDYKLPIEASTSGFKQLAASMMGTKLQGQATRDIFDGVSVAATAMNLSGEQVNGTYLALGQMMSKGKVQAEELRGQLGERLPGAFLIAARAMGVTQAKLNKMLEQGEVISDVFLPKFAAELKRTFEGALPDAINSLQANMNAFETETTRMKVQLGTELRPAMASFFETMSEGLREINPLLMSSGQSLNAYLVANKDGMLNVIKSGVGFLQFIADHRSQIVFLAKAYLTYKAAMIGYNLAIKGSIMFLTAYNAILRFTATASLIAATGIHTAKDAMAAFNLVTGMSPLGAIAALLVTAGTAFLLFRGKLKSSNDEFERFNKLNEDFAKSQDAQKSIDELYANRGSLSQRQAMDLQNRIKGQYESVEDQRTAAKIAFDQFNRANDIEALREKRANFLPLTSQTEIDATQSKIDEYNNLKKLNDTLYGNMGKLSKMMGGMAQVSKAMGLDTTDPVNPATPDATTQGSIDGIIAGGKKVTHVTLNIDTINGIGEVISTTVGENLDEIGDKILEVVTRALNGATQTAGN